MERFAVTALTHSIVSVTWDCHLVRRTGKDKHATGCRRYPLVSHLISAQAREGLRFWMDRSKRRQYMLFYDNGTRVRTVQQVRSRDIL